MLTIMQLLLFGSLVVGLFTIVTLVLYIRPDMRVQIRADWNQREGDEWAQQAEMIIVPRNKEVD